MNEVRGSLIQSRRIIFTPTTELKDELASTTIQITCFDRNGNEVKRVTSTDPGTVEDPEDNGSTTQEEGGENGSGEGGNTAGGEGTGSGDGE